MALKDIIAKLLGTEPTAETIATKIREAQDNRAALLAEIDGLNRSRQDMIGDPKAKERARKRIIEARDEIEDIEAMLPGLQDRYRDSQAQEAARMLDRHRGLMVAAFENLDHAITAADAMNRQCVSAWEAACTDLGHQVVHLNFPILYFGAPLSTETIDHWRQTVGDALTPARAPAAVVKPIATLVPKKARPESFQHRVYLDRDTEAAPVRKREPIRETAGEGEILVSVMRAGYESLKSGKQCAPGDVVALPIEIAKSAVRNSAVIYLEEGAAA
jgi:hypothetical protein